ncbi:transposase domain-containing protein, partial [Corallococcus sp. AB011P]|uniref:transposase domain-containing protein n=1 Tax=Corallococcus sp. AB011P TaxID=2316735 RepID=UPI003517ACA6
APLGGVRGTGRAPAGPPRGAIGSGPGQLPRCLRQNERGAALGRKNFLFVGHEAAGANLADLYALVATCEANQVNPEDYLADVLLRVQTHPHSRIGELLPHEWKRRR